MRYKYSKIWFTILCVFGLVLEFLMLWIYFSEELYNDTGKMFLIALPCVSLFMFIGSMNEYLKRYVEFLDESVKFNSFRIAKAGKVMSPVFRYENITSIESSYLPVIGVWKVKVNAKGFEYSVPISFCFNNYIELCEKLCDLVKEHNPDVYIDSRIVRLMDKKKKHTD